MRERYLYVAGGVAAILLATYMAWVLASMTTASVEPGRDTQDLERHTRQDLRQD